MRFAAPRSSGDLAGDLDRATLAMAAASAEALRVVAAFDERRLWHQDGATSTSSWLAGRYGLAWGTAREWVRVARALEGLPKVAEAFESGRLSWDQLRPLTRFATPGDRCPVGRGRPPAAAGVAVAGGPEARADPGP